MPIITVKSKPRTRLAPQGFNLFMRHMPQNSCHLSGVAAAFFAFFAFAFLEVSLTMIVTVHFFFIWKVRRIRITSPLRRDGANRLRVCCLLFHRPFQGLLFYRIRQILSTGKRDPGACSGALNIYSVYRKKPLMICSSASASVRPKVMSLMIWSPAILPMAASCTSAESRLLASSWRSP